MKKYMTQEVAIKSAWMILEGLGYDRKRNGELEKTVTAVFESAPDEDVVEARHGHFGKHTSPFTAPCSECGGSLNTHWHYCPSCGAKIEGVTG